MVISEHQWKHALAELELDHDVDSDDIADAMGWPEPYEFACHECGNVIYWQEAPGGGWWVHEHHPVDGHDALCGSVRGESEW